MMPYPTPTRYLTEEADQRYESLDEKNRHLTRAFTDRLREMRQSAGFNPARRPYSAPTSPCRAAIWLHGSV